MYDRSFARHHRAERSARGVFMQDETSHPQPSVEAALSAAVFDATVRAMASVLAHRAPSTRPSEAGADGELPALLSPGQTARLMGISRQTVDRMVNDGELPSITMRTGPRQ